MVASDSTVVVGIARVLIKGLNAESIEDIGVTTIPKVVAGGLTPVAFRAKTSLSKERGELVKALKAAGISQTVARAVVLLHRQQPLQPKLAFNPVMEETIRTNLIRRAQYLLNAARRLQRESDEQRAQAGASNLSIAKAIAHALKSETRYYQLHLKASHGRELAASKVDIAVAQFGQKLGWYTVMDDRATSDCLQANGKNFYANKKPAIGWPGMTHPECRCFAGRPHDTTETVYGIKGD